MPLAVTHVISTIILIDLFRDYVIKEHKKYLTLHTVMLAGVAGLLPDIDVPLNWLLSYLGYSAELLKHGGITHTPFFAAVFLIPAVVLWRKEKHKYSTYFLAASFGIMLHLILDYCLGGGAGEGVMWLWPISAAAFKIHLLHYFNMSAVPAAIDAVILLVWLWHEEKKHKISDFI